MNKNAENSSSEISLLSHEMRTEAFVTSEKPQPVSVWHFVLMYNQRELDYFSVNQLID